MNKREWLKMIRAHRRPRINILGHFLGGKRQLGQGEDDAAFVIEFFRSSPRDETIHTINDRILSRAGLACLVCDKVVRQGWYSFVREGAYHRKCLYVIDDEVE